MLSYLLGYWAQNQRCALLAFTFPFAVKTSFVCSSKMATGAPKKPPPRWADVEDSSSDLDNCMDTMSRLTSVAKIDADQHVASQQAAIGDKPSKDGLIEVATTTEPGACSSTYGAVQAELHSCTLAAVGGQHGSTPLDVTHGDACCCNGWYLERDVEANQQPYFLKLVEAKTGKVLKADSAVALRRLALRRAQAEGYARGDLYFLQTRVSPQPGNNRKCVRKARKWFIEAAVTSDQHMVYYRPA